MEVEALIELAKKYDDQDWCFSSSEIWKKVVSLKPTPYNLWTYADMLRRSGKYKKAKKIVKQIDIDSIPEKNKYLFYSLKGDIYRNQGLLKKAIKAYEQSIKFDPDTTFPYVFLGCLYSQLGKLEKSKKILILGLKKKGDVDEVNYNLATTYARLYEYEKAISCMKKCLEIDPNYSPDAYFFIEDWKNLISFG